VRSGRDSQSARALPHARRGARPAGTSSPAVRLRAEPPRVEANLPVPEYRRNGRSPSPSRRLYGTAEPFAPFVPAGAKPVVRLLSVPERLVSRRPRCALIASRIAARISSEREVPPVLPLALRDGRTLLCGRGEAGGPSALRSRAALLSPTPSCTGVSPASPSSEYRRNGRSHQSSRRLCGTAEPFSAAGAKPAATAAADRPGGTRARAGSRSKPARTGHPG
jgi:hypothetical protein